MCIVKNITKVNGNEVATRTPDINTENLKNGEDTTAEYNHRKDAISVKNEDVVEYNITIYNEGSIDGVASIIKDQLPSGIKFTLEQFAKEEGCDVVPICAAVECELVGLEPEEKEMFLSDLGVDESGLDKLIKEAYALLGLNTYFTCETF